MAIPAAAAKIVCRSGTPSEVWALALALDAAEAEVTEAEVAEVL